MSGGDIRTDRLTLRPATPAALEAALGGPGRLGPALGVAVPATWPPEYVDDDALRWTLARLVAHPDEAEWWMYFVLLGRVGALPLLAGTAGFKGPPDASGTVEVGYGIVAERHREGLASEATRALIRRAFGRPGVRRVIAETLPELVPSIGVMRRCGMVPAGDPSEPGIVRYELSRAAFSARS